jgi:hypothetical protein
MKRGFFLLTALIILSVRLYSQVNITGTPIISSFDAIDTPGGLQNLCITMDSRGVMFFGSQKNGIITYDGLQWGAIPMKTQQKVTAIATDSRGIVYAGGTSDFGVIQPDKKGTLHFNSIADRIKDSTARKGVNTIVDIASDTKRIYYADSKKLYIYDFPSDDLLIVDAGRDYALKNIEKLFCRDNRLFIADGTDGLFELMGERLVKAAGGEKLRMLKFVSLLAYGKNQILIATRENGIFIYNYLTGEVRNDFLHGEVLSRVPEKKVSCGAVLPQGRYAFGVENGEGIFIFDQNGALLQQISSETTGLPESTISAMYCDYATNSQLWFCSMGYISRAYVSLPITEFGEGTGLKACLGEMCSFNGALYVSFDFGVFKSFIDSDYRIRFTRVEGIKARVNSLIEIYITGSEYLLIATEKGLYVIDNRGKTSCVFSDVSIRSIHQDISDQNIIYAGTDNAEIITLENSGGRWIEKSKINIGTDRGSVFSIAQTKKGTLWFATMEPSDIRCMNQTISDSSFTSFLNGKGIKNDTINQVESIDGILYVCTGEGLYRFNDTKNSFEKDSILNGNFFSGAEVNKVFKTPSGKVWISGRDSRNFDALIVNTSQGKAVFRRQFDILPDAVTTDIDFVDGNIWIVKGHSIYIIDEKKLGYNYGAFNVILTKVAAGKDLTILDGEFYTDAGNGMRAPSVNQLKGSEPSIKHSMNNISFRWATTCYVGESKTEYRCKLDGYDREWTKWEKRASRDFTNLPDGNYTLRLRARTITGLESKECIFRFTVRKPWYFTLPFVLLYFIIFAGLVYLAFKIYMGKLVKENAHLEDMVQQRTAVVVSQKNELESSIQYASKIQQALLPSKKLLDESIPNYFILFKPRDIVSGDFYWLSRKEDKLFIVTADCTGHGVPGAFMSLLGISFLDEIVNKNSSLKAAQILNELRNQVVSSLKQVGEADEQKDGMDLSLIIVNYKKRLIEFSGAYNPCFKVRKITQEETICLEKGSMILPDGAMSDGKFMLETIRADKMPIGISFKMDRNFSQSEWALEEGVTYYLFTDGYIDQFNGDTGKKFLKKNLKQLIIGIQDYPMNRQKEILDERIMKWIGSSPQIDDILVFGIRF